MLIDIALISFLGFLSYCLYIVIIIPYRKQQSHELIAFNKFAEALMPKTDKTSDQTDNRGF